MNNAIQYYPHRELTEDDRRKCREMDGKVPRIYIAQTLMCSLRDVFGTLEGEEYLYLMGRPSKAPDRERKMMDFVRMEKAKKCPVCGKETYFTPCPACAARKAQEDTAAGYYVTEEEKYSIMCQYLSGCSCREIAKRENRHRSTIHRIINAIMEEEEDSRNWNEDDWPGWMEMDAGRNASDPDGTEPGAPRPPKARNTGRERECGENQESVERTEPQYGSHGNKRKSGKRQAVRASASVQRKGKAAGVRSGVPRNPARSGNAIGISGKTLGTQAGMPGMSGKITAGMPRRGMRGGKGTGGADTPHSQKPKRNQGMRKTNKQENGE